MYVFLTPQRIPAMTTMKITPKIMGTAITHHSTLDSVDLTEVLAGITRTSACKVTIQI